MKISFVVPYAGFSGGLRVIAAHARGLVERGHEVTVVSQPMPKMKLRTLVGRAVRLESTLSLRKFTGGHLDDVPVRHIVMDRERPVTDSDIPDADAVVATWWETAEWVSRLSSSKGKKFYFIQGDEVVYYEDHALRDRVLATWRLDLQKVVVARWLVDLGSRRSPGHPVELVENAVDTSRFNATPRGKQAVPTIGMVFQNIPIKGADIMIEAFRMARKQVPSLRLLAFGDAPARHGPAWPEGMPLEIRPRQSRLPEIYSSCDAWLFGTRREGFGLPILEAMACRTPVIGTPAGAAPELLAPGGGVVVRPEDPADMASAIRTVVTLPERQWRGMSDIAYETAQRRSWTHATRNFETALERGLHKGIAPAVGVRR